MTRERNTGRLISGTPGSVAEQLRQLADAYGTDDVIVNPMVPDERNRTAVLARLALAMKIDSPKNVAA